MRPRSYTGRRFGLRWGAALVLSLPALLGGCGEPADGYRVEGAAALASPAASDATVFEVIQRPLEPEELALFLSQVEAVSQAAGRYREFWTEVSEADNRMQAMRKHPIWREAGVVYEDFVAAFIKLNYLYEHLQEPFSARQAWENVDRLRQASTERGDAEAAAAVSRMKQIAAALENMERAGSLELYRKNQVEIERALDRFKSLGEQ